MDASYHHRELRELHAAIREGALAPDQLAELEAVLSTDREARQFFAKYAILEACLELNIASPRSQAAQGRTATGSGWLDSSDVGDVITSNHNKLPVSSPRKIKNQRIPDPGPSPIAPSSLPTTHYPLPACSFRIPHSLSRRPLAFSYFVATVATVLILMVASQVPVGGGDDRGGIASGNLPIEFVAQITGDKDCVWGDRAEAVFANAHLRPGQVVHLESGLAEVTFKSGAVAVVEGPAVFTMEGTNRGRLERGKLVAWVEKKSAKGFTVETPAAEVVDLGTKFGVEVFDGGTSRVHVFQGQVEVYYGDSASDRDTNSIRRSGSVIKMSAGEGAKFVGGNTQPELLSIDRDSFARVLPPPLHWSADLQTLHYSPIGHSYYGSWRDQWNVLNLEGNWQAAHLNPSFDNLRNNRGEATPVSFTIEGVVAAEGGNAWAASNPIGDDFFLWGSSRGIEGPKSERIGFRFSGLEPGMKYELTVFGAAVGSPIGEQLAFTMRIDANGDGRLDDESLVTVPAAGGVGSPSLDPPPDDYSWPESPGGGGAPPEFVSLPKYVPPYVTFTAVADAHGHIVGDAARIDPSGAGWSGWQLRPIK